MSAFSGPQGKGAARRLREVKRSEANARAAAPPPPPSAIDAAAAKARMCTRKDRYDTYDFALAVAARCTRREPLMRVYQCPACNGYHLTHQRDRRAS